MKFELWPTLAAHYWALTTHLSLLVSALERRLSGRGRERSEESRRHGQGMAAQPDPSGRRSRGHGGFSLFAGRQGRYRRAFAGFRQDHDVRPGRLSDDFSVPPGPSGRTLP